MIDDNFTAMMSSFFFVYFFIIQKVICNFQRNFGSFLLQLLLTFIKTGSLVSTLFLYKKNEPKRKTYRIRSKILNSELLLNVNFTMKTILLVRYYLTFFLSRNLLFKIFTIFVSFRDMFG